MRKIRGIFTFIVGLIRGKEMFAFGLKTEGRAEVKVA